MRSAQSAAHVMWLLQGLLHYALPVDLASLILYIVYLRALFVHRIPRASVQLTAEVRLLYSTFFYCLLSYYTPMLSYPPRAPMLLACLPACLPVKFTECAEGHLPGHGGRSMLPLRLHPIQNVLDTQVH